MKLTTLNTIVNRVQTALINVEPGLVIQNRLLSSQIQSENDLSVDFNFPVEVHVSINGKQGKQTFISVLLVGGDSCFELLWIEVTAFDVSIQWQVLALIKSVVDKTLA